MKLKFVCRGNSNPNGKAKIFFSAHPDDHAFYFDKVKETLLQQLNCSVWYDEEPYADCEYEELRSVLEQMNLVVFPVTAKLLTQKNTAISIGLELAQELHIPILPLIFESVPDDLYQKYFGNMHYFVYGQIDDTAIPFEEKLHKWLNEVLLPDERDQDIRKAFRAGIFLSYRKKDRHYAKLLINQIHKDDSMRDVAIWYDEFLSPGEDFNLNIETELDKSKVFVLAVTPNILEHNNYVMNIEYPAAVSKQKEVVAVEMQQTDLNDINHYYPGIANLISGKDADRIKETLENHIGSKNDTDTMDHWQKVFLIGLAYLNGTNVELDKKCGVRFITQAAEHGNINAMNELVSVYFNGNGVPRSPARSIEWKRKLVDQLESVYQMYKDEGLYPILFNNLFELAQNEQRDGDMIHAEKHFQKLSKLYETQKNHADDFSSAMQMAIISLAMGDIANTKGNTKQAQKYYIQTVKLRKMMIETYLTDENMPILRRNLAVAYLKLGDLEFRLGYNQTAEEMYMECYVLRNAAYRQIDSGGKREYEARRDYAVILMRLGELYEHIARLKSFNDEDSSEYATKAFNLYLQSLDVRKTLYEELRTYRALRDLILGYSRAGEFARICGESEMAETNLAEALNLNRQLAQESDSLQDRRDTASLLLLFADIQDFPKNLLSLQEGREIMTKVVQTTGAYMDKRKLSNFYVRTGDFFMETGDLSLTAKWYYKAYELQREIAMEFGDDSEQMRKECYNDLAISLMRMGTFAHRKANYDCLKDAFKLLTNLKRMYPDNNAINANYAKCYTLLENYELES